MNNKIKTIIKIIYKDKKSLCITLFTVLILVFAFVISLSYCFIHDIKYLIVYISLISMVPVLFSLMICSLFSNGKMIIFRALYKIKFSTILLVSTTIILLLVTLSLLPEVYYFLKSDSKLILLFPYIVITIYSLLMFSCYFTLFVKNRKVGVILIGIITQIILSINTLSLVNDYPAKFVSEHFSIIGILLANKINWAFYGIVSIIPILFLFSILLFKNKINWAFYEKKL
ncbi:hypothetical protein MYMA111404_03440 [Mycoplasma marinum]|uniref:hypothetical protein n=1 Tax=Mycoplasma marinum TaxID=1937190 RepID=UPI003B378AB7